jgi:hypothetical protein
MISVLIYKSLSFERDAKYFLSDEICAATFKEMIDVQESEAVGNKKVAVVEENT